MLDENRVLIADDDRELCALLAQALMREGMKADICLNGLEAVRALENGTYQLVVLDVMMPGMDGFEALAAIRRAGDVPVLMLTAKGDSASKVRGLRDGADDYLTKPFDMEEFLARAQSLIRRYTCFGAGKRQLLVYRGLEIDRDARSVHSCAGTFELPPKEFDVLMLLARHQGRILTKQQIYEAVWNEPYVYDDSNIMAVISRLRRKIEPDPAAPTYIQTVKGVGYRFSREV